MSRQAVSAIEAGRTVPGTAVALRLARALRCGVEDLFQVEDPAPEGPVHASAPVGRDGTRTLLGRVGDRIVAHPLSAGRAVAEGFVAADGLLLRTDDGGLDARFLVPSDQIDRTAFLLGCDPSLSLLAARFARRTETERLHRLQSPSRTALDGVKHGTAHVGGCHLRDSRGEDNAMRFCCASEHADRPPPNRRRSGVLPPPRQQQPPVRMHGPGMMGESQI